MLVRVPKSETFSGDSGWYFMEIPRTGTSTIERTLRHYFPDAKAPYQKHWPIRHDDNPYFRKLASVVSVRNPFSRAVSCWQYFTKPDAYTFQSWLEERLREGFCDVFIEARPQSFWYELQPAWKERGTSVVSSMAAWDFVIRQESLEEDFHNFLRAVCDTFMFEAIDPLPRYNDINGPWVNKVQARPSRDRPWQEYYCKKTEELVLELYDSDFEVFSDRYSKDLSDARGFAKGAFVSATPSP